jgi:hypothetical protein
MIASRAEIAASLSAIVAVREDISEVRDAFSVSSSVCRVEIIAICEDISIARESASAFAESSAENSAW